MVAAYENKLKSFKEEERQLLLESQRVQNDILAVEKKYKSMLDERDKRNQMLSWCDQQSLVRSTLSSVVENLIKEHRVEARNIRHVICHELCPPTSLHVSEGVSDHHDDGCCVVCMSQEAEEACLPCGHLCLCTECSSTYPLKAGKKLCPLCRMELSSMVRIYKNGSNKL